MEKTTYEHDNLPVAKDTNGRFVVLLQLEITSRDLPTNQGIHIFPMLKLHVGHVEMFSKVFVFLNFCLFNRYHLLKSLPGLSD